MSTLLTTKDIAERFGVTIHTAARWCREGMMPNAQLLGRDWVAPQEDVESFTPPPKGPKQPDDDQE